jgi:hypothetical protein
MQNWLPKNLLFSRKSQKNFSHNAHRQNYFSLSRKVAKEIPLHTEQESDKKYEQTNKNFNFNPVATSQNRATQQLCT